MTDKAPTRLQDARAMKRAGWPLNTPVEEHTFSEGFSRHWLATMDAQVKFYNVVLRYATGEDPSPARWWSVLRRFIALEQSIYNLVEFWMVELGGNTPPEAAPMFRSEQDAHEYAILKFILEQRICPYLDFWQAKIDNVEAGNATTFTVSDIPPWVDDE
ncbi:hypothetical protein ACT4MK_19320 [Bradyrhizobium barranii]|uniref:hypothetical protein n=1 Tax=Bradyrhizobium TaxID=374 RepID=UPI003F1FE83B